MMSTAVAVSSGPAMLPCPPVVSSSSWCCGRRSVAARRNGSSSSSSSSSESLSVSSKTRKMIASGNSSFVGSAETLSLGKGSSDSGARRVAEPRSKLGEPLKVMIAGAPASGKGTQCELIKEKFGLAHISAGDLLRAEVDLGTEDGRIAKEHMTAGKLVPIEIVVGMVRKRLSQPDARAGWLLDGYPRSLEQAEALEALNIRPDIFILLDVPDDILVDRVVGRRSDPVTGKIYHLTFSPPETEEIASRLVQRFDDDEVKVKARVVTHHANVGAVVGVYKDVIKVVDGNRDKYEVFAEIDGVLSALRKESTPAL